MTDPDCFSCRNTADPGAPLRERIVRTEQWRVAHAVDAALAGWLILLPVRHVRALDELEPDAAAELGPLLTRLTAALKVVTRCEKTYVLLLAEKEGFSHVHFHVVPRAPGLPSELRGPRIFALLGAAADARVPYEEQDAIGRRLQSALAGVA